MTSCAFCDGSRPKFGESNGATVADVGYKGVKSGSSSKLVGAIADGRGGISRREGVAVSTSGSAPYSQIESEANPKAPLVEHGTAWRSAHGDGTAKSGIKSVVVTEGGREITLRRPRRQRSESEDAGGGCPFI